MARASTIDDLDFDQATKTARALLSDWLDRQRRNLLDDEWFHEQTLRAAREAVDEEDVDNAQEALLLLIWTEIEDIRTELGGGDPS